MSTLIYVHGTNGSGKSTLARRVALAAGGFANVRKISNFQQRARWTTTGGGQVMMIGKYANRCGGVDGVQPYAAIFDILAQTVDHHTFAEGLITPGVDTCERMASMFDQHLFIGLATPIEQCVRNVVRRRAAARNMKPYDPSRLIKKAATVLSWTERLAARGLNAQMMTYRAAYLSSLELFGLHEPSVEVVLGE